MSSIACLLLTCCVDSKLGRPAAGAPDVSSASAGQQAHQQPGQPEPEQHQPQHGAEGEQDRPPHGCCQHMHISSHAADCLLLRQLAAEGAMTLRQYTEPRLGWLLLFQACLRHSQHSKLLILIVQLLLDPVQDSLPDPPAVGGSY